MEALALVLMFFGILAMVGWQILTKRLLKHFGEAEVNVATSALAAVSLVVWFVSPLNTFWNGWMPPHPDSVLFWGALLVGTLANAAIRFATTRSYARADLSLVAPIQAMTPGLIVVSAMLIGEFPSAMGYTGIFLIMVGTYVHIREGAALRDYLKPLFVWRLFVSPGDMSHMSDEEKEAARETRSALQWAYGSAVLGTLGLLSTGIMSRHGDVALGNIVDQTITTFIFLAAFPYLSRSEKKVERRPVRERIKDHRVSLALAGILYALQMVLIMSAFRLAPIAYIGSFKRISIFLTVLLAVFILKETTFSWRRIGLASIIVTGAVLLALDPTQVVVLNSLDEYLVLLGRR